MHVCGIVYFTRYFVGCWGWLLEYRTSVVTYPGYAYVKPDKSRSRN